MLTYVKCIIINIYWINRGIIDSFASYDDEGKRAVLMKKSKQEWFDIFRVVAVNALSEGINFLDTKKKITVLHKAIRLASSQMVNSVISEARIGSWSKKDVLNEILLLTYASYIVMLEYRNEIWPYEYMSFSRRIGELWEPFCKLPFQFSNLPLTIVDAPKFETVQEEIREKAITYILGLKIQACERESLIEHYNIPWSLVDSGGIKLSLDLHFEQNGKQYSCDFKSGFSSNEKGNTNRLLLVGSIYNSLPNYEQSILFVRQQESQNNHYFQVLKKSDYWKCYCADECYHKIQEFTGFNLRLWLDQNVDWKNDISTEFRQYLEDNSLIGYLNW